MSDKRHRAVFLDRDGVIVEPEFRDGRSFAPRRMEDFRIYPDASASIRTLREAGFLVIVATNQPDVGAGHLELSVLESMHQVLKDEVAPDDIEVCCDTRAAAGNRRKPNAGMLFDAARRWQLDLSSSYMIGDRWSDIEAGEKAGCTSVFIDHGYTAEPKPVAQSATVRSLGAAVDWILAREKNTTAE